ncbi:MAG: serine--tRNA ligase [Candidatus Saccharimonadales bacterium]
MLDIQYIRDNAVTVQQKSLQKGYKIDVSKILQVDLERRELLQTVEQLRQQRNVLTETFKRDNTAPSQANMDAAKVIKLELAERENYLKSIEETFQELLRSVPNMPLDVVPLGMNETENKIAREWGEKREFSFSPQPHWHILESNDMLDKHRAAKISGSRFAYIKGGLVQLQFAIMQFVTQTLADQAVISQLIEENALKLSPKPFVPVLPPALLRTEPYIASARLNAADVTYKVDGDDLWLNASAEHTLCTMYWNEILDESVLPIRYLGYSTSFRREAGTYGKDTEGIIRLHQFDKLEMEIFSSAETGGDEHKLALAIQEYLMQQLGLPYRVIQKCTYDIGKPNASGFDIDGWFPGQDRYIETHTADYMTDYQSRDLKIRTKGKQGTIELVHTNDATAFALGRILACIVENYQTPEGGISIPNVLRPYMAHREAL